MAVNVFVHDDRIDIELSGLDRLVTLKGRLEIDMADVVDARVARREDLRPDISWRLGGTAVPGKVTAGHFATPGRPGVHQLWCTYADPELLVVETRLDSPWRVVLQHPDREFLAWVIGERIHR